MAVCARYIAASHLNQTALATITGLQRDLSTDFRDNNYVVYYRFMTLNKRGLEGTYLLENPARLGDMPRMGTQIQVAYSAIDPGVNRPRTREEYDLGQAVVGEFLLIVGAVFVLAGWKLT